ncbi:MAG: choice-of-anchor D domain-containing protein, partial [Blastocatellia bacterium]|nr:choice-of-anchor D domain-containing protein [Blastocatellia bacterium]
SSPAITALRPGQSTSFEVLYKPTSLAAATGTVTIMSSGGAATVQLAANRSRAEIDVNPTAVDFGTVAFGQAASRLITIRNQGNAPLSISRIVFDVTSDKRFSLSSQPISSIPVGGSENLQVDFKASSSGVATASLLIASDGGNVTVSLKANSVDFEPPRVAISSPVGAESIVAGSQFPIRFSVTDNDLVSGVVLSYSLDGGISIASDIARLGSPAAGTQQSFVWNVPDLVSSAQAVVKVTAIDRSGNSGTAISNSFSIQVPQTTAAVLRVIVSFDPPTAGQFSPPQNVRLNAFERKTATEIDSLQSTNQVGDPGTLIGYNIYRIFVVDDKQPLPQQIVSPANLVGSISADKNSFTDDISTVKGNNVAYSVTSLFGTGGESQGSPPVATNLPVVKNPRFGSGTIFIDGPGSFIQPGATLIVNDTDTFSLQLDSTGIQYTVSKREPSKPSGAKIKKLVKKGKSVKLNVQNPDGKLSVSVSFIRS